MRLVRGCLPADTMQSPMRNSCPVSVDHCPRAQSDPARQEDDGTRWWMRRRELRRGDFLGNAAPPRATIWNDLHTEADRAAFEDAGGMVRSVVAAKVVPNAERSQFFEPTTEDGWVRLRSSAPVAATRVSPMRPSAT